MCEITYLRGDRDHPPRKTSESKNFPFTDVRVPIILVQNDRIRIANGTHDKLTLLRQCGDGDTLLAAWPGQKRQDIFVIDEDDFYRVETILKRVTFNRG